MTVAAGERVQKHLVDLSSRSGYSLAGAKARTKQEMASEYYNLDWESGNRPIPSAAHQLMDVLRITGDSPEQSSWIAAAWVNTEWIDSDEPLHMLISWTRVTTTHIFPNLAASET